MTREEHDVFGHFEFYLDKEAVSGFRGRLFLFELGANIL